MKYWLISLLLVHSLNIFGQDLFSIQNTSKYAEYLYNSANFQSALDEYQRLVFLDPTNFEYQYRLIKCYRYTSNYQEAIEHIKTVFCDSIQIPELITSELLNNSILNKAYDSKFDCFGEIKLEDCHLNSFYSGLRNLYTDSLEKAEAILMSCSTPSETNKQLYNAILDYKSSPKKSPLLATSMSAIIPGSGKIYTGYWKDGLVTLAFVTLTAWLSYRGFSKNGSSSVYGWVYGIASFSFYIGNLFGSGKSAHMYNLSRKRDLFNETDKIFRSYID